MCPGPLPGTRLLLRLCAAAAVLGGGLRVVDAYLAVTSAVRVQQIAYFVTDVMLLLGLCGIYFPRRKALGFVGFLGFAAAVAGLLIVRSSSFNGLGPQSYLIGATVTLVGVVVLGMGMLVRVAFPKLAPALWIASAVVGLIGLLSAKLSWAVTLAGVIFGIGFVAAGISLFKEPSANLR